MTGKTSRRAFLKTSTLSAAALTVGGVLPGFSARSYRNIPGANERILTGMVGVNSRGAALAGTFAAQKECLIRYVSDTDSRAMTRCIGNLSKIQAVTPTAQPDFRKVLEQKDVDVMVIATPDHWHAPAALLALQAGKHVYLEKPCSHNPREGEMLIASVKKHKRLIQMGNQRRSWPNVMEAIRELHNGIIGNAYFARTWYANSRKPIGTGKAVPVPGWLNYDLWQGPAPRKPYMDNRIHYNWHWFWHWGTGEALNNGTHMVDLARWGLQVSYPTRVTSSGGRYFFTDDWQTPDTQTIGFEFGSKGSITWEGRSANGRYADGASVGVIFFGEKGALQMNGDDGYQVYSLDNKLIKDVKSKVTVNATNTSNPAGILDGLHVQNLFDGIKKGTPLNSDIESGHISTLLVQLGNIAQRTSGVLDTNPRNGHILNNTAAEKLWSRTYEKGWEPRV
ncbi:Tat (twin-arginine translocation) pathway signal sequence [Niabella drilacis]|uniref:Tat (Twin-arginine translocation) pathway signal sequence n=1 Tax=Niabella drilacis (strain DSM 25811 / CCM 8410 / CCUG 62505 / LMG 26954 / E90) TaxID=1285928 RepID=A0A1G6WCI6_NIADE|nr:Tat (twin-arginine translocation) pathway signal sequence [Niabella drilacis]